MSVQYEKVLAALDHYQQGRAFRCPAHDDRDPSLSVRETEDGRVLLHCFAGCTVEEVCDALGLAVSDLFPPREEEGSTYVRPSGLFRLLELQYPAISFLTGQSLADRRFYLDDSTREAWLRERYPEVPPEVWAVLKE